MAALAQALQQQVRQSTAKRFACIRYEHLPKLPPMLDKLLPAPATVSGWSFINQTEMLFASPTRNSTHTSVQMAPIQLQFNNANRGLIEECHPSLAHRSMRRVRVPGVRVARERGLLINLRVWGRGACADILRTHASMRGGTRKKVKGGGVMY